MSASATTDARPVDDTAPGAAAHPGDAGVERQLKWFRAILGLGFLATLLLSRRAWLSSGREYPLVPVIDGLPQPPFPVDWMLFAAMAGALLGMSFARRPRPFIVAVLAIMGTWLALDQTRWQPYILTLLAGTACLLLGESRAVRAAADAAGRWHVAPYQLSLCAVYAWSGVHKLNVRFLEHTFPAWVHPVTRILGTDLAAIPVTVMRWGGLAAAAGEAAMGLALLWPRTRRPAVVGLTLMHAYIMLRLGAGGRLGNTVVWPWNVVVVASLWLLFWPREPAARLDRVLRAWRPRRGKRTPAAAFPRPLRFVWGVVLLVFAALPALSFAERWYASLSFQLYAGKNRHVWVQYRPDQRAMLPAGLLRAEHAPGQVDLIRWSIMEMNVTPVMETHVVTRIGRALARRAPDAGVRVVIAGAPALVSGERGYRTFAFSGPEQAPREIATTAEIPRIGPRRRTEQHPAGQGAAK